LHADQITPLSSSLTLPLNEALQKSDGAQFALMLSLLFETRAGQSDAAFSQESMYADQQPAGQSNTQSPSYNLNHSLSRALQSNNPAHFNLINSLYHEKPLLVQNERLITGEHIEDNNTRATLLGKPGDLLSDIHQSQQALVAP
jgi:hypothetical protein